MIKINRYKIRRSGQGVTITIPKIWLEDNNLDAGDLVEIYRDEDDRLVIVPKKEQKNGDAA